MYTKMHEIRSILLALEKFFKNVQNRTEIGYLGVFEVTEHEYNVYFNLGLTWKIANPDTDVI